MTSEKKIKIGVVGCGVVATAYYLPYLRNHENAEVVALCDLSEERITESQRLFGCKESYTDYFEMIDKADINTVFILTGPGTHMPFTLKAIQKGKHVLLQKPMATTMEDARAIYDEAKKYPKLKVLIEPSENSPLHPKYRHIRKLINKGVLGDPYWFNHSNTGPDHYHPALSGNPYGAAAFYNADSGGVLFDFPYGPNQIVSTLGSCKKVCGMAKISVPDRSLIPEEEYTKFLKECTGPDNANYWDVVEKKEKSQKIRCESFDNTYCIYEMENGALGSFHVGRPFHPVLPGMHGGGLQIFGTEGNLIFGGGTGKMASFISSKKDLLPETDEHGWYHIEPLGDYKNASWPRPIPEGFNYYHQSSQHLIDCILNNQEPIVGVDWGLHITEMMWGVVESARTGKYYEMTSRITTPGFE